MAVRVRTDNVLPIRLEEVVVEVREHVHDVPFIVEIVVNAHFILERLNDKPWVFVEGHTGCLDLIEVKALHD